MAGLTPVEGLVTPADTDPADQSVFNNNFTTIDGYTGVPRLTQAQINALTAAQSPDGIVVYNTTIGKHQFRTGGAWVTTLELTSRVTADIAGTGAMVTVFSFPIGVNETWMLDALVYMTLTVNTTFAWQITAPAGASGVLEGLSAFDGTSNIPAQQALGLSPTTMTWGPTVANRNVAGTLKGFIINGANAGTVNIQCNTANTSAFKAGSSLRAKFMP